MVQGTQKNIEDRRKTHSNTVEVALKIINATF